MPDLYDAVAWRRLEGKSGLKVGYADGAVSAWPAEAYDTLTEVIPYRITVLADPAFPIFDSETGNAGTDRVAQGVAQRLEARQWSVIYTNQANLGGLEGSLRTKGLRFSDGQAWPAPAVYLWAAAPGTTPGHIPGWCPVYPVAVQDRWETDWDISSCYGAFPSPAAPHPGPAPPPVSPGPAPGPPPPRSCTVNLPVLEQGASGPAVVAVQKLVGGLTVDGVFGPQTRQHVITAQLQAGLAGDGIVGTHTWGHLLGAPQ
jgi:peptidoglycan hydrolase-like protein with peptidoglycan-binding domain